MDVTTYVLSTRGGTVGQPRCMEVILAFGQRLNRSKTYRGKTNGYPDTESLNEGAVIISSVMLEALNCGHWIHQCTYRKSTV